MAKVTINKDFLRNVMNTVEKNLIAVGMSAMRDCKRSMSGYGAYSNLETKETVKGVRRQKTGARHYPAPPGAPPAVDTGRLRDSITVSWTGCGRTPEGKGPAASDADTIKEPYWTKAYHFTVIVGTNVEYATYLEFGTRKMAARPYLRPVFDTYTVRLKNMVKSLLVK